MRKVGTSREIRSSVLNKFEWDDCSLRNQKPTALPSLPYSVSSRGVPYILPHTLSSVPSSLSLPWFRPSWFLIQSPSNPSLPLVLPLLQPTLHTAASQLENVNPTVPLPSWKSLHGFPLSSGWDPNSLTWCIWPTVIRPQPHPTVYPSYSYPWCLHISGCAMYSHASVPLHMQQ